MQLFAQKFGCLFMGLQLQCTLDRNKRGTFVKEGGLLKFHGSLHRELELAVLMNVVTPGVNDTAIDHFQNKGILKHT